MRTPIISPIRRVRPASLTPRPLQPGDNLRGALLMCLSMVAFTCNDAVMKLVMQDLPLYQSVAMRGVFVALGVALVAWRDDALDLRLPRGSRWPMVLRLIGELGSTLMFLTALRHMAIGDLSAIMQALPLVITLAAALFFGETFGWRRMLALATGFVGVVIILRPGGEAFGVWSLLALGAMLMVALRDLATRRFGADVRSATIALYTSITVMLTGFAVSIAEGWRVPEPAHILLLALAGGFLTIGYITAVSAMRVGEMSFVAPFRYTSLLAAILLGLVIFGEWPDVWTLAGAALVVGAGAYNIWRETKAGPGH